MITNIECYYLHSSETFHTFHRMFYNMSQIIFEYSVDFLRTFPGMFGDIPRNVLGHFSGCLRTFPRMFENIPRNITFPLFPALPTLRSPFLYSWFYIHSWILSIPFQPLFIFISKSEKY